MNHYISLTSLNGSPSREECLKVGKIEGDYVVLTNAQYAELQAKYTPERQQLEAKLMQLANGVPLCRSCGE